MQRRHVFMASAAALAATIGLSTAWATGGHIGHGWDGHRGGLHERMCGPDRAARVEAAFAYVREEIDVRPDQDGAWFNLVDAVRGAVGRFDAACTETAGDDPAGLAARLARAETMMVAGLAVLRDVRPALDAFTAVLDDDQRRRLDALAEHHRG